MEFNSMSELMHHGWTFFSYYLICSTYVFALAFTSAPHAHYIYLTCTQSFEGPYYYNKYFTVEIAYLYFNNSNLFQLSLVYMGDEGIKWE
jgi:hypothetical protein